MKTLTTVPTKILPDYNALGDLVREHGAVYFPPGAGVNKEAARSTLHRQGLSCYPLDNGGVVVAPMAPRDTRRPGQGMPQAVKELVVKHLFR